jgi:hypothetical protein
LHVLVVVVVVAIRMRMRTRLVMIMRRRGNASYVKRNVPSLVSPPSSLVIVNVILL